MFVIVLFIHAKKFKIFYTKCLTYEKKMLNYIYWKVEEISSSKPKQIQTTKIRRPPMRITNFIKNYPMIIITVIFLLSGIFGILIQSKVYALTEKANTPGCACVEWRCTTIPPITPNCYINKEKKCECGFTSFKQCDYDKESKCTKIEAGCGRCRESDCTNPQCRPGCGRCRTIIVYGCTGAYPNCGYCAYDI